MSKSEVVPASMPSDRREFEEWVIARSTMFSVVLFKGRGQKDRQEFPTLQMAIEAAADNPRKMVYAAMESGRAVMIGPKEYPRALQIVGTRA